MASMALHSNLLCRLCLETSDDLVNIFDNFHDSTIASVLTQHFWFQVDKNDSFSEWLCQTCWINTETFHRFYKRIESCQTGYWNVIKLLDKEDRISDKAISDIIKQERSGSPQEVALEPVLNILKFEETEPEQESVDLALVKAETSDDHDNNSCDQSNFLAEYRCSGPVSSSVSFNKKQENNDDSDNKAPITNEMPHGKLSRTKNVKQKEKSGRHRTIKENADNNRPLKDKEKARIREFFDMKCDICSDVTFETLGQALKHYRIVHKTRSGYITCCNKRFSRRCTVMDHIEYHLNPDAFRCTTCNKQYKDGYSLKEHAIIHLSSARHNCSLCTKSYKSTKVLLEHQRTKHSAEKDKTFQCDICKKYFFTKASVASHLRRIHALAYVQYHMCEICARVFKNKYTLRDHMQESHSTTVQPKTIQPKVQCNICGAWSKSESVLQRHLKRHREDYAKCPICNKVLQHSSSLRSHISFVHGERRHRCLICHKALSSATSLKEHMAGHTGEDLYKCPYCEKTFKSNGNMYAHRKKAHFTKWNRDFSQPKKLEKVLPKSS